MKSDGRLKQTPKRKLNEMNPINFESMVNELHEVVNEPWRYSHIEGEMATHLIQCRTELKRLRAIVGDADGLVIDRVLNGE